MNNLPSQNAKFPKRLFFYLTMFVKWTVLSALIGFFVGTVATAFNHLLKYAALFRTENPFTLWLLPFAGLFIAFIYQHTRSGDDISTDLVIKAVRNEAHIPVKMAPLIFIATAITHAFGGSAGREGAALQLGGSLGEYASDKLKLGKNEHHVLVMCGMSAAFSALFGTPMAAAVFSLELASIGAIYYFALVPCVFSSVIAVSISRISGIAPERFHLADFPLTTELFFKTALLAMLCGGLSIIFCSTIHHFGHYLKKLLPCPYKRIFAGGCAIAALTYIVGSRDYLGAGMDIIEHAVEGHAFIAAFILKLVFTAITLGSGYKGGEIVPTLFVGSTFGCVAASLLGLPAPLGAAIGMMALFCGVTNCPIASLMLAFELFSFSSPVLFMIAVSISYMLSGCYSLYSSQKIVYAKHMPEVIDRTAH